MRFDSYERCCEYCERLPCRMFRVWKFAYLNLVLNIVMKDEKVRETIYEFL